MNYWLVKSDPETYGWTEFSNEKKTAWTGVRNYAARLHLKGMKKNDLVLFYHSNQDAGVVGTARVIQEFYQDPTTEDTAWVCVDLECLKPLKKPVSLAEIKAEKKLKDIPLIKIGRLSVMPVKKDEFDLILKMGS